MKCLYIGKRVKPLISAKGDAREGRYCPFTIKAQQHHRRTPMLLTLTTNFQPDYDADDADDADCT